NCNRPHPSARRAGWSPTTVDTPRTPMQRTSTPTRALRFRSRDFGHGLLFSVSLLGLALLPLLSPSPARAALAVTGALLLSAVLVAWFSRPRTLGPDECERLIRELSQRPELTIISLTSSENERRGRAGSGYAAVARVPGARSVVLLEASEPASVLDAALRWQRVYG